MKRGILSNATRCALLVFVALHIIMHVRACHAADRLYRLDPAAWTLYSVTRSLPAVLAPDGSTVTPFLAGPSVRGNVGPAGYHSGSDYQTGLHVTAGGLDEFSIFYKWLSGPTGAHLCIDGNITGYEVRQCADFDGATAAFNGASQAIVAYSIAQVGADGWWRVSITFHTAGKFEYGDQAFPYVQVNPGQRFALWRGFLVTGRAP